MRNNEKRLPETLLECIMVEAFFNRLTNGKFSTTSASRPTTTTSTTSQQCFKTELPFPSEPALRRSVFRTPFDSMSKISQPTTYFWPQSMARAGDVL